MITRIDGRSRGFTLVEMSIVLVIIGLIIGGILKGQEIITSARQKAVINQVNAVRAATNTYFDRYRALPGDDPAATNIDPNLAVGNGNGIVGASAGATAALIAAAATGNIGENYQFFNGLVAANLINGAQVTAAATATVFGANSALPASPITGAGVTIMYGSHPGLAASSTKLTHWLRLHKTPAAPAAALSPRQLANIDSQTDDGVPDAGGTRGDDSGAGNCNAAVSQTYAVSDNVACVGLFEITQ